MKSYKTWVLFVVCCLIAIQFFYVLGTYQIIESEKVFYWTLLYCCPVFLVVSIFCGKRIANLLFHSTPNNRQSRKTKKIQVRERWVAIGLLLLMTNFFTYNSIILTNDWFGSGKQELVHTTVTDVEFSQVKGHESYIITLKYKERHVRLTSQKPWNKGDTFEMILNTGGYWHILFKK